MASSIPALHGKSGIRNRPRACKKIATTFAAAAILCCTKQRAHAQAKNYQVSVNNRDVECNFGKLKIHDVLFTFYDQNQLSYLSLKRETEISNTIRPLVCFNNSYNKAPDTIRDIILKRAAVTNACMEKSLDSILHGNLEAAAARMKTQNQSLKVMYELMQFSAGKEEMNEQNAKGLDTISEVAGVPFRTAKMLRDGGELLGLTLSGSSLSKTYSIEKLKDRSLEKLKDEDKKKLDIPEDIYKAISDKILNYEFKGRLSEIQSFSYSECM